MIRSRTIALFLVSSCLPLTLTACSGDAADAARPAPASLISDALHSSGTPGFYWLAPMVPAPSPTGVFAPDATPTVRIDRLGPNGSVAATVATFTTTSGSGSEIVRVDEGQFIVNWNTRNSNLDPASMYRIRVLVPGGRELGFADVDVVSSGSELRNVATSEYIPLLDGRTLPIKFRIERVAVDRDADGVPDGRDNCPSVANADQADSLGNGVGDACRCDGASTDDGNACTVDACSPSAGVTHAPAPEGASCGGGNVCRSGACESFCAPGTTQCGSECVAEPAGFYPADGYALDIAGGRDATFSNALYAPGRRNQAFAYSSGRYTTLPSSVGSFGPSNFTISLWFNTTTGGNLLSKRSACWNGSAFTGEDLRIGANGALFVELWSTQTYAGVSVGSGLTNGQWHHVAIIRQGNQVVIYLDGVAAGSTAFTGAMTDLNGIPTYLGVGRCVPGAPGSNGTQDGTAWFNGRIDDVGYYAYAMSPQQLQSTAQGLCLP